VIVKPFQNRNGDKMTDNVPWSADFPASNFGKKPRADNFYTAANAWRKEKI